MSKCVLHQGRGRPPKDCEDCARNALESALESPPRSALGDVERRLLNATSQANALSKPASVQDFRRVEIEQEGRALSRTPKRTQAIPPKQAPIRKGDADWPEIDRKLRHPVVPDPSYPEFPWCMAVVDGKPCTAPADSAVHVS